MGRGAPECYVDPQDDEKKVNRGDSVCTSVRCGGCNST